MASTSKPDLTEEERRSCEVIAAGAGGDEPRLLEIIERLTGRKIIPADEASG